MVKYRVLSAEELKILEQDFVQFLVTNSILANDWETLKEEEPDKANELIDIFSDIVMEKALSKIEYLRKNDPTSIICVRFIADRIQINGLVADPNADIDFTDSNAIQLAITNPPKGLKVVSDEQQFVKSRNEDVFAFMQQGFQMDDGKFFQALALSQKQRLN